MAVGVPETAVFAAADRVLARGERPTVERVRLELGRGSPARIGQLLEHWWEVLAQRLAGEARLPDLPPAVAEAFKAVWVSATDHGTQLAQASVASRVDELTQDQARLANERSEWQQAVEAAHAAQANAETSRQTAEARVGDLQRLLEQQAAQHAELLAQRDALSTRAQQLEAALAASQAALTEQRQHAGQERQALQHHVRATEEHAHAEIDRARQETKTLQGQLAASQRALSARDQQHRQDLDAAQAAVSRAERETAAQRARADALELQLARLGDLPAAVQASLAHAQRAKPAARALRAAAKKSASKTANEKAR